MGEVWDAKTEKLTQFRI